MIPQSDVPGIRIRAKDKWNSRSNLVLSLLLAMLTVEAFWGVWGNDFIDFDDNLYVFYNKVIQAPFSWKSVRWAFTASWSSNWHPLTWLSLQLDYNLFQLRPGGYHLTNLGLHVFSTILLFLALERMTGARLKSAMVAALFAVHPLHVESVAWIAERKDVLCGFFWMLTLAAYAKYSESPGALRYLAVLFAFVGALLSKPMAVTLPCVLLLLDYWPLARMSLPSIPEATNPDGDLPPSAAARPSLRWLIAEKLPFFLLSGIVSYITWQVQTRAINSLQQVPMRDRILNSLISYAAYLGHALWPRGLTILYVHPRYNEHIVSANSAVVAGGILAAISILVLCSYRRRPYLPVGWLWYLGVLVPVIGIAQIGFHSMADRYTYLPLIGVFIIATWGVADLTRSVPHRAVLLSAAASVVLAACTLATLQQVRYWHDTETLWQHAVEVDPNNHLAHMAYIDQLRASGKEEEALYAMEVMIRLRPKLALWHNNFGVDLWKAGREAKALQHFSDAVQLDPKFDNALNNLGLAYSKMGRWKEANESYRTLVELQPENVKARCELAYSYEQLGDSKSARDEYRESIKLDPAWPAAAREAALQLATSSDPKQRDVAEALKLARQANHALEKPSCESLETLAIVLAANGKFEEAIATAKQALALSEGAQRSEIGDRIRRNLERFQQGKTAERTPHESD